MPLSFLKSEHHTTLCIPTTISSSSYHQTVAPLYHRLHDDFILFLPSSQTPWCTTQPHYNFIFSFSSSQRPQQFWCVVRWLKCGYHGEECWDFRQRRCSDDTANDYSTCLVTLEVQIICCCLFIFLLCLDPGHVFFMKAMYGHAYFVFILLISFFIASVSFLLYVFKLYEYQTF